MFTIIGQKNGKRIGKIRSFPRIVLKSCIELFTCDGLTHEKLDKLDDLDGQQVSLALQKRSVHISAI